MASAREDTVFARISLLVSASHDSGSSHFHSSVVPRSGMSV